MSSFYENLVSGKYDVYEKTASVNDEAVKDAIAGLSSEQIDALYQEIGAISKVANEITLENSLFMDEEELDKEASEEEVEEVESTEDTEEETEVVETEETTEETSEEEVETEEEAETEESVEKEAEESEDDEDEAEEKKEDKKEDKKDEDSKEKKEDKKEVDFNPAKTEKETTKCASEDEMDFEKLSEEEQFEMIKEASEQAAIELAEGGYTLADYVYSMTGTEKCAYEIAEQAEKLAKVAELPVLMVANDIIDSMNSIVVAE